MKQKKAKRVVVFGGSFNPPGKHHWRIAKELARQFDLVIVVPCGPRTDKPSANVIGLKHKKEMTKLAFASLAARFAESRRESRRTDLPKIQFDFFDLDNNIYTPTYLLQKRYEAKFPNSEIWHFVGSDIIIGGRDEKSEIHRVWNHGNEIWKKLNFVIGLRPDYKVYQEDLPPKARTIEMKNAGGSGTEIRRRIAQNKPIDKLVTPEVKNYIIKHALYSKQ